jgi:hypothetical protein
MTTETLGRQRDSPGVSIDAVLNEFELFLANLLLAQHHESGTPPANHRHDSTI